MKHEETEESDASNEAKEYAEQGVEKASSRKIFDMLDLFYANKHLNEKQNLLLIVNSKFSYVDFFIHVCTIFSSIFSSFSPNILS